MGTIGKIETDFEALNLPSLTFGSEWGEDRPAFLRMVLDFDYNYWTIHQFLWENEWWYVVSWWAADTAWRPLVMGVYRIGSGIPDQIYKAIADTQYWMDNMDQLRKLADKENDDTAT